MRSGIEALNVSTRIVEIPNGVAWDEFQTGRSNWLRENLAIAADCPIVLSVGRNLPTKNYLRAMSAFDMARKANPGACYRTFECVSDGFDVRIGHGSVGAAVPEMLKLLDWHAR